MELLYSYIHALYLFSPRKCVLYFSMNLNSSLHSLFGKTLLTLATLKISKENDELPLKARTKYRIVRKGANIWLDQDIWWRITYQFYWFFSEYWLVKKGAKCEGADKWQRSTDSAAACAEACAGAADMFIYRNREGLFQGSCHCQYLTKNSRCRKEDTFLVRDDLYSIESKGKVDDMKS